jgi:Flp pilus assembly protein TadG
MSQSDITPETSRKGGLRRALARFQRNRDGATAIEFGLLAVPFCLLLFAILESCISFAAQQVMSNVTDDVAREIRTGRLLAADINATTMRAKICGRLEIVVAKDCPGLVIDLRDFATFAAAAAAAPIKLTGSGATQDIDTTGFAVRVGGAKTRNMLRVFYRWPVMTDMVRLSMSNIKGRETLLFATATWMNEPF